ncbi:MAG: glycosyltransferase [Pelagibacterales bacterium]|nr:glycosyltransferase [Pelagibacterales bacterium]
MNICFIDKTDFIYNSKNLYSQNIRGAESILINLSNALSSLGYKLTIINNCPKSEIINGVKWININSNFNVENYDLAFSNGDCRLFDFVKAKKKILFSHSLQSIEKFIRKKQLLAYLKHKPIVCFLSKYHLKNRSKILHLFGSINLRYAVDDIFLKAKINENVDNNLAIFTSRKDRNLELLVKIWKELIYPQNNELKLLVSDNDFNFKDSNIFKRHFSAQQDLVSDLLKTRVFLIPGHKAELFCLAAEEAKELCLPIVTLGIGCLEERVEEGKTGFVARSVKEFSDYTIELFKNDDLWNEMRKYLISIRGKKNWINVAKDLINQL